MFTLFDLDEHYRITIHDVPDEEYTYETHKAVQFNYFLLDEFFEEWALRKKELAEGIFSKSEYIKWKLNWTSTEEKIRVLSVDTRKPSVSRSN